MKALAGVRRVLAAAQRRGRRAPRWLYPAVFAACCAPLLYVAVVLASDLARGTRYLGSNPIREAEHFTGEWTLRFLMFTLGVTPARELTGWNWLIRYRRTLGVFTFFYAMFHWSTYLGLDMMLDLGDIIHDIKKHPYIMVGMAAFLLLVPLAVTSTRGWVKRLGGRRWNELHSLVWPIAAFGLIHFAWGLKKDMDDPIVFASIFAGLFAYRIWRWAPFGRRVALPGAPTAAARSEVASSPA